MSKIWGDKDGEGPPELGGNIGNFSVRLHAKRFLQEGRYVFNVFADDRSRVRVDGKEIISAWKVGSFQQNGSILLQQGWHNIEVDYMNDNFNAYIKLNWKKIP
ncbi:MAG: hypothetical protein HC849_16935 [Oscillatoriales cyanobacterium RU_3_3]|nr:hypothetical protein [Leptolyngbyaceae cyanobacterium SU_3_3]NJL65687.1 hypothetical protein [Microcoleus sp. SM1_3_4]NJM61501.1 hypothetical protein [Oscillatoriales cyanobacterium RU_3_3]